MRHVIQRALASGWPAKKILYASHDDIGAHVDSLRDLIDRVPLPAGGSHPPLYVIDEIQKFGGWPEDLKSLVDRKRGRFLVACPSAQETVIGQKETWLGRIEHFHLYGLNFFEYLDLRRVDASLPGQRDSTIPPPGPAEVEEYFRWGGFPQATVDSNRNLELARTRMRSDLEQKAIRDDILSRHDIAQSDLFILAFSMLMRKPGQILNNSHLTRDLMLGDGNSTRTVDSWLHHLEEAGLIVPVPKARKDGTPILNAQPKVFPLDPSMAAPYFSGQDSKELGVLAECGVFRHLLEACRSQDSPNDQSVGYWRQREGEEVDFVVRINGKIVFLEVTTTWHRQRVEEKLKKLDSAIKGEPESIGRLLCWGKHLANKLPDEELGRLVSFADFFSACTYGRL